MGIWVVEDTAAAAAIRTGVARADSLVEVDDEPDADADDPLVDSDGAADSLVAAGWTDSLPESEDAVESLVDSGAADSLVLSEAEPLVTPVLPGVRTVLPSVARVLRFAAVTSYETGVMSDMIYAPSVPPDKTSSTRETTVDLPSVSSADSGRVAAPCASGWFRRSG